MDACLLLAILSISGCVEDICDVLSYEFGDYQVQVMYRDKNVGSILLRKKTD